MSKKQLAAEMGFDPSYVSHVEARRHRPTEDFARRAEMVLDAGGEIWQLFLDFDRARHNASGPRPRPEPTAPDMLRTSLVVEYEEARLTYVDGEYRCSVLRDLHNTGREAITRYPCGSPSTDTRVSPIGPTVITGPPADVGRAEPGRPSGGEPMSGRSSRTGTRTRKSGCCFENDESRFPLYPGERVTIEYAYTVGEDKWGHWFQRAIRQPTRRLAVRLDFPADLRPVVWGVESSLTAEAGALKTPVRESIIGDRIHFDWETDEPALNARYRLEWRFRSESVPAQRGSRPPVSRRASELMRGAGILQRGAPMLDRAARWFELPEQTALASDVVSRLLDAVQRVSMLHEFHKGLGLAAPQIGIDWAAAVVEPPEPDDDGPVVLLNPRIVGESVDHDEQYEGCLSFFDVRGLVSRPLLVEVEHEELTGERRVTTFRRAMARLVAHEVDHLGGLLYPDRMPSDGRSSRSKSTRTTGSRGTTRRWVPHRRRRNGSATPAPPCDAAHAGSLPSFPADRRRRSRGPGTGLAAP
jgi:peptide deformylase